MVINLDIFLIIQFIVLNSHCLDFSLQGLKMEHFVFVGQFDFQLVDLFLAPESQWSECQNAEESDQFLYPNSYFFLFKNSRFLKVTVTYNNKTFSL